MYDVIIIGKGPAGISASLYTSRAGLNTLVLGGESSLSKSHMIENYYGFESGITGSELLRRGVDQTKRFGTKVIDDMAIAIEYDFDGYYIVKTMSDEFNGKTVLLATGSERKRISIEGIDRFEGKGVHYCTTCDGYFYRGKKVAVLGYNKYALNELEEMKHFTGNLTVLTNGNVPEEDFGEVKLNKRRIKALKGDEYLEDVVFEDDSEEKFDAIFVAYGTASSVDFARKLGVLIQDNLIEIDENQRTNLEGLYAAGDCASSIKQVAIAVGQGCTAGMKISEYIRNMGRQ